MDRTCGNCIWAYEYNSGNEIKLKCVKKMEDTVKHDNCEYFAPIEK
jgi:hypothetical protein